LIVGGEQDARESAHGAALRGRLAALGLERRVHFLSAQPQRRLRLFYAAADATVVPSF
jgi:D-inositol-3-phosphate glycosyltransferase